MTVILSPLVRMQFNQGGIPLAGGKLFTYTAGTTTKLATYTSSTGGTPNTNPIILDANGQCDLWITAGLTYKFVLSPSTDTDPPTNSFWTVDNISDSVLATLALPSASGLIGYIAAGPSAVARTVQARLRDQPCVLDYGVVGDGSDETINIQAAIDSNPGQRILFPSKRTYAFTGLTVSTNGTVLVGDGNVNACTEFIPLSTSGYDVLFYNCQHSGIENVLFNPAFKKTSGFAVVFTSNTYKCYARKVRVDYCFSGFGVLNATETEIDDCNVRYLLGDQGIYYTGAIGAGSYGCKVSNFQSDNPYPQAYGPVKAYAALTAFTLNDIVNTNGKIWQCSFSGTTGAASAPSGYPGTTPANVFTTDVVDGSAKWKFVCSSNLIWILQDNYSYSLTIDTAAVLHGFQGFAQVDGAATGTSYPMWCEAWDLEVDHPFSNGVTQAGGEGLYCNGSWFGSSLTANAVTITSTARGEVFIGGGTRIMGNFQNGVVLAAGPKNTIINGCFIGDNSQQSLATFHGVSVAANATDFQINGNRIGDLTGAAGNPQGYGVFISAGTSDNYSVVGNNLKGNTTGGLVDAGTGTNKSIGLNPGANPGSLLGITVGASPFTYTNNRGNNVSLYVSGGTVSSITMDGIQVATATNTTISVPQGVSVVVTYTVLPTMQYRLN